METTVWILKSIIALIFILTGFAKIFFSKDKLLTKGMKGLTNIDEKQIKVAGILEVLGSVGLIMPTLLNIYPILSAVSAICLGLTMIVAGWINYNLKLSLVINVIIFIICLLIAYWELL